MTHIPPATIPGGDREVVIRECAEVANKAYQTYNEPTDWAYGAQDACTKIERAILAFTNRTGEPSDEVLADAGDPAFEVGSNGKLLSPPPEQPMSEEQRQAEIARCVEDLKRATAEMNARGATNPVTVDAGGVGEPMERANPNSTLFEDETFFPLEVLFGSLVYIWQQDGDGGRSQITTSREAVMAFAQHVFAHAAPAAPTHVAEHLAVANAAPAPSGEVGCDACPWPASAHEHGVCPPGSPLAEAGVPAGMVLVPRALSKWMRGEGMRAHMDALYDGKKLINDGIEDGLKAVDTMWPALLAAAESDAKNAPKQATPTDEAAVLGERALLQAFVIALTDGGKNRRNCLSINHDRLAELVAEATAALKARPAPGSAGEKSDG
jgi:hypothetical protein